MKGYASSLEKAVNATLGSGLIGGSGSIQIWTYGLLREVFKDYPGNFDAGVDMLGVTFLLTAGALGIIGGYKLLKHAKDGEEIW